MSRRPVELKHVLFLALASSGGLGACDSNEHGTPPPWATGQPGAPAPAEAPPAPTAAPPAATAAAPTATPAAAAAGADTTAAGMAVDSRGRLLAELRARKWKADDFVESEANRDPFRSFISDFSGGPTIDTRQYEVYLSKFSLDELKVAMITSPRAGGRVGSYKRPKNDPECDSRPCAMFVDGSGAGVTVSRNFHISKSDARVVRIDPEKGQVFVELTEDLGNGKSRVVERVLDMHPNVESQSQ